MTQSGGLRIPYSRVPSLNVLVYLRGHCCTFWVLGPVFPGEKEKNGLPGGAKNYRHLCSSPQCLLCRVGDSWGSEYPSLHGRNMCPGACVSSFLSCPRSLDSGPCPALESTEGLAWSLLPSQLLSPGTACFFGPAAISRQLAKWVSGRKPVCPSLGSSGPVAFFLSCSPSGAGLLLSSGGWRPLTSDPVPVTHAA